MNEKTLAKFFYEQCAGTHSGHMANIANNPVLFGLIRAATDTADNCYAASQADFAKLLREFADQLDPEWPDEARIDTIDQNDNDGAGYLGYTLEEIIFNTDLDDWVCWVAVDKDGEVWIYSHKPVLSESGLWQPASHLDVRLKKLKEIAPPSNYRNCLWEVKNEQSRP